MSPHEFDSEHVPHLEFYEIENFKYLAQAEGVSRPADFPHLQPTSKPAFFTVYADADTIGERWPRIPHDSNEMIVDLTIEYNEPMVDKDGMVIPSAVAVDIDSIVGDPYGGSLVEKQVHYLLLLDQQWSATAIEFRSDDIDRADATVDVESLSDKELADLMRERMDNRRSLRYDDVQLLRYLIS